MVLGHAQRLGHLVGVNGFFAYMVRPLDLIVCPFWDPLLTGAQVQASLASWL